MEQKEEHDVEKFPITLTVALSLSLAVQWLFGKEEPSTTKARNSGKSLESSRTRKFR
jgi:hypothetical protein